MRAEQTCSWLPDAVRDLASLATSSTPALARRLRPAVERIAHMNGGTGTGDALMRSGSTPFVPLVEATALDLGLHGDPRTALIGRATVMFYLYVRLQDDLVDEEALVDRATVYAMEAALSSHLELFAQAGVPADAMIARSRLMTRFAAVSAREVDDRGHDEGLAAERAGEKFLPMAVPLIALASLAGRTTIHDALAELVIDLGTALQMVNDVLNAPEDHAAGRTTPLLRALARDGLVEVRRAALVGQPAVTQTLDLARAAIARAADCARALELATVAALVAGVCKVVDSTHERLLGQALGLRV